MRDLEGHRLTGSAEFRTQKAEALDALKQVHEVAQKLEVLERVDITLKTIEIKKVGESTAQLRKIDAARPPEAIRPEVQGLRGLGELKQLATRSAAGIDAASLQGAVARLEGGLARLPGADPALGKMIQQEFAVRAALEGHAEGYFRLMPEAGPAEHAGKLLRDLKAATLGEGTAHTTVVSSALPAGPGAGPQGSRPPPGLEPLIPEGARSSWRPPVRESARADLPPLERATEAGAKLKQQAQSKIETERATLTTRAQGARLHLGQVHNRVVAPQEEERRRLAEIETQLKRQLQAVERARVRDLVDQNRTTDEILQALEAQLDEKTFLARVEQPLGRRLTPFEVAQVKRLRQKGRTIAAIVSLLRREP
jgi:hypothetical protein